MLFVDIADTKPKNIKPTNKNPGVPSSRQAKTKSTHALSGTLTHLHQLKKLRWSNAELLGTSVIDTTIPAVYQICST
jgi:hypothetical protein